MIFWSKCQNTKNVLILAKDEVVAVYAFVNGLGIVLVVEMFVYINVTLSRRNVGLM